MTEKISCTLQDSPDHQLPRPLYLRGSAGCGVHSLLVLKASAEIVPSKRAPYAQDLREDDEGDSFNVLRLFIINSLMSDEQKHTQMHTHDMFALLSL